MTDEKKEKDQPENEAELLTMHHIVSDGKARPGAEEAAVFGFEPQPLNSVAAGGQEKEQDSDEDDSKEEKPDKSQSPAHHIISDGWSAK